MYVCRYVCLCTRACGGQRSISGAILQEMSPSVIETRSLTGLELANLARLAGQQAPGILSSLLPEYWMFLEIKLRSSCLYGKHLTNHQATSKAHDLFFLFSGHKSLFVCGVEAGTHFMPMPDSKNKMGRKILNKEMKVPEFKRRMDGETSN